MQDIYGKASKINPEIFTVPHNGTQQIIVAWGIIGLIFMVVFLLNFIKKAKKVNYTIPFINYIMFMFILLFVQAGQLITADSAMLVLSLSYVCLSINENNNERIL